MSVDGLYPVSVTLSPYFYKFMREALAALTHFSPSIP
jgi:hypothetical protein